MGWPLSFLSDLRVSLTYRDPFWSRVRAKFEETVLAFPSEAPMLNGINVGELLQFMFRIPSAVASTFCLVQCDASSTLRFELTYR